MRVVDHEERFVFTGIPILVKEVEVESRADAAQRENSRWEGLASLSIFLLIQSTLGILTPKRARNSTVSIIGEISHVEMSVHGRIHFAKNSISSVSIAKNNSFAPITL